MNLSIYIHGVPFGFDFFSPSGNHEQASFMQRYYKSNKERPNELCIESLPFEGKNYFYYTYIIGKNVIDSKNNRPGAYLGLTIRLDTYYKKAVNLYYLLDSFFHSYLYGKILKEKNGSYSFLVNNLSQIDKNVFKDLESFLGMSFSESDLCLLKAPNPMQTVSLNFADADDEAVMDAIKRTGKVSISQSYDSKKISEIKAQYEDSILKIQQDHSAQIQKIIQETDVEISTLKKQYSESDKVIEGLKNKCKQEEKRASDLSADKNQLQNEIKKQKVELNRVEAEIKKSEGAKATLDKIQKALAGVEKHGSHDLNPEKPTNSSLYRGLLTLVNTLMLFLCLLLLLARFAFGPH